MCVSLSLSSFLPRQFSFCSISMRRDEKGENFLQQSRSPPRNDPWKRMEKNVSFPAIANDFQESLRRRMEEGKMKLKIQNIKIIFIARRRSARSLRMIMMMAL